LLVTSGETMVTSDMVSTVTVRGVPSFVCEIIVATGRGASLVAGRDTRERPQPSMLAAVPVSNFREQSHSSRKAVVASTGKAEVDS
jgi:hypothetical protein